MLDPRTLRLRAALSAIAAIAALALSACGDPATPEATPAPDAGAAEPDASTPDAAEPEPAPEPAPEPEPEPEPEPDPSIVGLRFDPGSESFYRVPWPSDGRLTEAGTPDLSDFPRRMGVVDTVLTEIERSIHGFATMPVIYVGLRNPVAEASLPTTLESALPSSPIQLIDLSERGCGRRVPIDVAFRAEGDLFTDPNVLQIKNTVGTVLTPGSPYALVITQDLGAPEGRSTPRPAAFDAVLNGADESEFGRRLAASLEPLRRCLPQTDLALEAVAMATVFTPQDPVEEMQRLRDFVMDPEALETRGLTRWERSDPWTRKNLRLTTYTGAVQMPVFQQGDSPYAQAGGGLVFDEVGRPVVQRWEEVEIAVAVRTLTEPFEGPRPVLVFIDGTGWSPWFQLYSTWVNSALDAGYVVMSFMPQFHGGRAGFGGSPEISTFNFINPAAGRSNFRQQAAETSYFLRLVREQIDGLDGLPPLDTGRVVYGGHSQGALCGAIVAAVEDQFSAYVFNGLSAYLTLTLLHRKTPIDFQLVVKSIFGIRGEIDAFSPVVQLMQLGAEAVDPHNFVRRWRGWPENPGGNHVFVSNGFVDDTTTPRGMDHMTMAADMPPINPPGWEVDEVGIWEIEPVALPVQGNVEALDGAPLTLATFLHPVEGHFTIHRQAQVREMALRFWDTARQGGTPQIASRLEAQCGDGADDDDDGLFDCEDPNCAATPPCVEGICDDALDNDENGLTDCADAACVEAPACVETECGDDTDNDGDGLTDCADPQCARRFPCAETRCNDDLDDDGDGDIDCDDGQCARSDKCVEINCVDSLDSDGDGAVDCDDADCRTSVACDEPICDDGLDDDANGLTDCDDPGCVGVEACPLAFEAACGDGQDDDGDGDIDCDDPDCAAICAHEGCADADLGRRTGAPVLIGDLSQDDDDWTTGDCVVLGNGGESRDRALLWTAPATGRYVLSTKGSDFDTTISVYPPDCDRERELTCDDDEGPIVTSNLLIEAVEGEPVVIVISGYNKVDAGPFRLHIIPQP